MKALIKDGIVQNLSDTEYPQFDNMEWVDCPDDCQPAWKYIDGQFIAPEQPKPSKEEELKYFNSAMQIYIDSVAIQRGYQSGAVCVSYWISSNQSWADDAKAFAPWRDRVWELVQIENLAIDAGGSIPDVNQFTTTLPQIVWPS